MRVGLLWPQSTAVWNAGTMYFENLHTSAAMAARPDEQIVRIEAPAPEPERRRGWLGKRRTPLAPPIVRAAAASGADVLFGDANQMHDFGAPWIGWIPDFQHRALPEYFDPAEIAGRDTAYTEMAERAARVLLSSEDARRDFEQFAPERAHKARVASFVSLMDDAVFSVDPTDTVFRHGITGPFVVVPNQWWRHKNHEAAIRAAGILRARGSELTWVFTGALSDYRAPGHADALLALIDELGLAGHARVLGMIDRDDQLQLMRAAEMVVQPSLFEGWSTVVEDAKTLGQRIVLSDLDVHREQEPPAALFFERHSAEDLAAKVEQMLAGARIKPDEREAHAASLVRAEAFGRRFLDICAEAAGEGRA